MNHLSPIQVSIRGNGRIVSLGHRRGRLSAASMVGVCLLALGAATLRSGLARPGLDRSPHAATANPLPEGSRAPLLACGTAFALTAMNPATVVGFVGIIAALAPATGQGAAPRAIVLGVFLGSMLWWSMLVALVRGTRHLLSPASMRLISLASAAWLLGAGLLLLARSYA